MCADVVCLVHPVDGDIRPCRSLIAALDPRLTVTLSAGPGLGRPGPPGWTLSKRARRYVSALRTRFPQSAYRRHLHLHLAGWSFGTWVCANVAAEAEEAGLPPRSLHLIDPPPPGSGMVFEDCDNSRPSTVFDAEPGAGLVLPRQPVQHGHPSGAPDHHHHQPALAGRATVRRVPALGSPAKEHARWRSHLPESLECKVPATDHDGIVRPPHAQAVTETFSAASGLRTAQPLTRPLPPGAAPPGRPAQQPLHPVPPQPQENTVEQYELDALNAITTRPPRNYQEISVAPLTPTIGAEVSGVHLGRLSDAQLAEIGTAFLDHHVLVFRDQEITVEDHKRFAGHFGELRPVNPPPEGDPYVLEIKTGAAAANVAGNAWHADGTADAEPSLGSMLYITETPEGGSGGDTLFANMHLAYEMLSPTWRGLLDGLTAVHDGAQSFRGYTVPPDYEVPVNEHPLVVRHPATDRPILYVNQAYTARIPQLSQDESQAVLEMLFALVPQRPLLTCRVRWTPNTLVFWDNRCVQHHATYDYYPQTRYGRRVAINGGPLKG